jgi:hypothetical protein
MIVPFSTIDIGKKKPTTVGTPVDGVLIVQPGQTIDILGGSVMRYRYINIKSGGTLRITGNTASWTEIAVTEDFICNGTLVCRAGYPGEATHATVGPISKTSVFGFGSLSYSIVQVSGGDGGRGGMTNKGAFGGSGSSGIGGGGGGGCTVGLGKGTGGSNGAAGLAGSRYSGGAGGGLGHGANGSFAGGAGASGGGGGNDIDSVGGGGGGYKGHHGKGLALHINGKLTGSGQILCSGANGFNGGSTLIYEDGRGGGGGGGAGGSGGSLKIAYRYKNKNIQLSVAGGSGGNGGLGGGLGSFDGGNGATGNNGSISIVLN